MIAAASGQELALGWVSALVGVVTLLVMVAKAGHWFGAAEAHLKAQDETLAAQDRALAELRDKLDDLRDHHDA